LVVLVPGLLALVFGWLAFRSRVTGVYLSILTQAMTLALALYLFQNDSGLRGNNGLSGLQNMPGLGRCGAGGCRSGSSGPRPRRWGWLSAVGLGRVGQVRVVIRASAMTRRGCGSSATRSRATSCSSSP
jgi:ABC-type branched-subunit amino acid transport system permease subunit